MRTLSRILGTLGLALCIAGCSTPRPASADAAAQSFDYMAKLRKSEADLKAAGEEKSKRSVALQGLATEQSRVGDTESAIANFDGAFRRQVVQEADRTEAREIVARHDVRDAIEAIVAAARDRQIVILNEGHHVSRHRAFATLLALELRKLGFDTLAVETLETRTEALAARGYPLTADGWYSSEPVFGDFLRRALVAGYTPVAYERTTDVDGGDQDWIARIERREMGQAENLEQRVFAKNPQARLFVYVGYSHALEEPVELENGRRNTWMAARLREKTGIDPLTIDQATVRPVLEPLRDSVFASFGGESAVLASREGGELWKTKSGFDLSVLHRPTTSVGARPHWLAMNGYRRPRAIPAKLLPKTGRRLVQAFVANESADAVPMDQVLVEAGKPPPKLMLPRGNYRFAVQD